MQVIDITRIISPDIAVWPGDHPYQYEWTSSLENGESANVGAVSLSTHTGTHADAPKHVLSNGAAIDEIPISQVMGTVEVVDIIDRMVIKPEDLSAIDFSTVKRVLFRTRSSFRKDNTWEEQFVFILPETAEYLTEQGVVLVGTDSPSVDPFESEALSSHKIFAKHGTIILENLQLRDVTPGQYQLVALPIKLAGLDAAPVRAVLFRE